MNELPVTHTLLQLQNPTTHMHTTVISPPPIAIQPDKERVLRVDYVMVGWVTSDPKYFVSVALIERHACPLL